MSRLRLVRSDVPAPAPESGCVEAFETELDYVFGTLQRLGARPSDMDDLLQDIFLIFYRNWSTLDRTRSLRPWLFAVAFRVVRTHRRRRARECDFTGIDVPGLDPDPEEEAQHKESLALLWEALERVPVDRRSVLIMHELQGLEVIEIARQLSLTKFGVYARLYKGRKELTAAVRRLLAERTRS
jgi:RNA polymerase sigma factor (sigma-70 family)